ncbi:MAG: GDP-mannose 4,6-dehydratase, partial [Atopobiaceae bacterium]|nr:GDP-mannose 4,6-dehydratase [Atopobiaceae bacterium]
MARRTEKQPVRMDGATILVTGAAGFIGAALVERLIARSVQDPASTIIGVDNLNDYYDVKLKRARLRRIEEAARTSSTQWVFEHGDIAEDGFLARLFEAHRPSIVVNLAAQAGVRYSIDNPEVYITSNIIGFHRMLEACRTHPVEHLVFASSSSVYGGNRKTPFAVGDPTDTPVSLYAATKKSDELIAHAYAKLFDIPTTGLR